MLSHKKRRLSHLPTFSFLECVTPLDSLQCSGCGGQSAPMVSPTMKAVVDAVWAVWSIGASIYDYIHTNAMEERIHTLENVISVHQFLIGLLSAGVLALFTYILFKKLWRGRLRRLESPEGFLGKQRWTKLEVDTGKAPVVHGRLSRFPERL